MKRLLAWSFALAVAAGCGRTTLEICPPGTEGCACYGNATCNAGLVCVADTCELENSGSAVGSGGMVGSGGVVGNGGVVGSGGVVGHGGAVMGGTMGMGGTTSGATFHLGRAEGAMTGYGWVALGSLDTLTAPTCGGKPVLMSTPCTTGYTWPTDYGLCMSGSIPALPAAPTASDYNANWGIILAAGTTAAQGGGLGAAYASMAINLSGSPQSGLRAMVHRKGDSDATSYCTAMVSGQRLAFASFNTACWDGSGMALTAADVPGIDWVGVQVYSTSRPIAVANLCLESIFFE
jgi:hypothetical protein